jgi:hypothetical protein
MNGRTLRHVLYHTLPVGVIVPQVNSEPIGATAPARERLPAWCQGLVWAWAAVALVAIYIGGQRAELDRHVANRLQFHAIPMALSVLYHGRPHDYTAFASVAMLFQQPTPGVDEKIARAINRVPPRDDATYYWVADDRGMGDYVIAAFVLFGPRVRSLYLMYFVVLGASVSLFLADLGWHPLAAGLLIFALGALYTCTQVLPLGNLTLPIFEPGSLYEPRVLELLSYIAALHLGLTACCSERWTPRRRSIVAAQAAICLACYHARSTITWQLLFVVALGIAWSVWRRPRVRPVPAPGLRRWLLNAGWPIACLAIGLGALKAYQRVAYNPGYFRDVGARTIWHNALMGLWVNEHLAQKYSLRVNDGAIVAAVGNFLRATRDGRLTSEWTESTILGALGGHSQFNWFTYEGAARDFYRHIWRSNTRDILHCYLVDKPREIVHVVVAATGANVRGLGFRPLAPMALTLAMPGFLVLAAGQVAFVPLLAALVLLLACSMLPGLLFYPVVHTMSGVFATIALIVYVILANAVALVMRSGGRWPALLRAVQAR